MAVGTTWQPLPRSNNNQWVWTPAPAQVSYPVTIRITPVCGDQVSLARPLVHRAATETQMNVT